MTETVLFEQRGNRKYANLLETRCCDGHDTDNQTPTFRCRSCYGVGDVKEAVVMNEGAWQHLS